MPYRRKLLCSGWMSLSVFVTVPHTVALATGVGVTCPAIHIISAVCSVGWGLDLHRALSKAVGTVWEEPWPGSNAGRVQVPALPPAHSASPGTCFTSLSLQFLIYERILTSQDCRDNSMRCCKKSHFATCKCHLFN